MASRQSDPRASHVPHPAATLQQGEVRARTRHSKNSQAHPGVTPLNPVTHRNVGYQPLPRPIGLAPFHYSLTGNFADIGKKIAEARKMTFHVLGDSGGVQDGEFQNNVAEAMIKELDPDKSDSPQFCYAVAPPGLGPLISMRSTTHLERANAHWRSTARSEPSAALMARIDCLSGI